MTLPAPPGWLERFLLLSLSPRDRETISGDLLEEYREERVPRLGSFRANVWYARQSVSFLSARSFGGPLMKAALTWMSVFTAAAGAWLIVMEHALKHAGYAGRMGIATLIVIESLATLLFVAFGRRAVLRALVLVGAVAVGLLGVSAIQGILQARHFEGFVLVIGSALVAQSLLTIGVVVHASKEKTS
jgi:hypothetical protein